MAFEQSLHAQGVLINPLVHVLSGEAASDGQTFSRDSGFHELRFDTTTTATAADGGAESLAIDSRPIG